jgi:hypothetical protein
MKMFLSKTIRTSLKNYKSSNLNTLNTFKYSHLNSAKFSTSVKGSKQKENIQTLKNPLYTTSSYLSEQNIDTVNNLKSSLTQETENKKNQMSKKFLMIVPLVFAPFTFHVGLDLLEGLFASQFFHYSFQIAIKHMFLLNTFNTGIILGYTLSLSENEKNMDYQKIFLRLGLTFASFFLCNVLVSCPMNPFLFNGLFLSLIGSSVYITKGISNLHPLYAKYSQNIILIGLTIMLMLINYYYKEWHTKISEEGKFEETVKFYELSKDREFAKVMDRLEKNLKEIDVKIARKKEE